MLLTKIVLEDYGIYRGRNAFDFTCTKNKPIILIGGTNGAGKTTLFESIMVCLYGISSLGKRTTKKSYMQFLSRKIHRYSKSSTLADHAAISVQFKFYHNGNQTEYLVERSWRNTDGQIHENLNISKRSGRSKFRSLETIERSNWQSFIQDLIPRGIVELFFFDGEKIVEIAEEGIEDQVIKESFKSLLGINIVEQLRADLHVNMMRSLTNKSKTLQQDFEKYKSEKDEITSATARLRDKLASMQTEMDSLKLQIEGLDSQIAKIGGAFASDRESTKLSLAVKRITYESIHGRIQDICSGVLPFAIIPKLMQELSRQIMSDEKIQQQNAGCELAKSKLKKIIIDMSDPTFWKDTNIEQSSISEVSSTLKTALKKEINLLKTKDKPVFALSAEHTQRIHAIAQKTSTDAYEQLKKDTEKINEVSEEIGRFETLIANVPADDEVGPIVSKLGELHMVEGALQADMDYIEANISSNVSLKQHLNAKIRDILSQIYKNEKVQQHIGLTQDVQRVLDEFIERLTVKKIHLLEQYILEAINILMHKKDFITKVTVNPETFEVTLFKPNNEIHPRDILSKGEQQMLATGILWALARTSGRPLPFMIDTPLARLDSSHRKNIIEEFFFTASHQILIFSTDKEVEYADYKTLKPYISRSYTMEYVEDEGMTLVHDGYFWNKVGKKIVAV